MNTTDATEYRRLKRAGVEVSSQPTFRMNNGSETREHQVCKLLTARLVMENGWNADCEVTVQNKGEIDVVAYAPERLNYAIELETTPDQETKAAKLTKYVRSNSVIDDMELVDISDVPDAVPELEDTLRRRIGLW